MTAHALSSLRRTGKEIGGMLLLAAVALMCVAAVNQKIEKRLDSGAALAAQTTFAEKTLPVPEEPAPPVMVMISSPMDGVFQAGNVAGGPALVAIGTGVTPETKLGSIQPEDATAMPILAGVTGTVKEILVKDQDMVMAGQALIKIEPQQMPIEGGE
jgi:biotin carboxyl carrier protein